jgi:hypothetical protein
MCRCSAYLLICSFFFCHCILSSFLLCRQHNYLVRLLVLVEQTLATCNKHCMACGEPLVYVGLKPTVCSKDLCKYGFEDLGAGFDLSGEVSEQPQVVDLLITGTVAAVAANRMVPPSPLAVPCPLCSASSLIQCAHSSVRLVVVVVPHSTL